MARKSNRSTPTVISGTLYTDDSNNGIDLDTQRWAAWLDTVKGFYYQRGEHGFSVQKQAHRNGSFWYAYKRISGKLHKKYVGKAITRARLEEINQAFAKLD